MYRVQMKHYGHTEQKTFFLHNINISSQVAWRPFHIQSFRYQGCTVRKVLNIFYTLFIFLLIIFGYTSNIIACQARLDVKHKVLAFLFVRVELFIALCFLTQ